MTPPENGNGDSWLRWSKYILEAIKEQHEENKVIRQDLSDIKTAIAGLQVKAGLWGAVAGAVPAIGFIIMKLLVGNV